MPHRLPLWIFAALLILTLAPACDDESSGDPDRGLDQSAMDRGTPADGTPDRSPADSAADSPADLAAGDQTAADLSAPDLVTPDLAAPDQAADLISPDMLPPDSGVPDGCLPCSATTQCDDKDPCTVDSCGPSGCCVHSSAAAGITCDDTDLCTKGDQCDGQGKCVGAAHACSAGTCEASSVCDGKGGCAVTNKPAATLCDDGNACTKGDVCDGKGTCAGTPYSCTPGACEAGSTCDGKGGCAATLMPAGTQCDDGKGCTVSDTCDTAGACVGQACSSLDAYASQYKCSAQTVQRLFKAHACSGNSCAASDVWKDQVTCTGGCQSWCNAGSTTCGAAPKGTTQPAKCTCDGVGGCSITVSIPATANLYGAGHATAPAPGGSGAGVLPLEVSLPPGKGRVLTVGGTSGTILYGTSLPPNGPDGCSTACTGTHSFSSYGGIAGLTITDRGRFLTAVFLDGTEPKDPAPAALVIPTAAFISLTPGLRQTFYVGDGLTGTGSGAPQQFKIPDAATRLFLGFLDASKAGSPPCCYGDNSGSLKATLTFK